MKFLILVQIALVIYIIKKQLDKEIIHKHTGNELEDQVQSLLHTLELQYGGKTFRNIYVPIEHGRNSRSGIDHTEIDLIYLINNMVIVIECKNYAALIKRQSIGQINSDFNIESNWTAVYKNGKSYQFRSPIKQNRQHIKHLKRQIDKRLGQDRNLDNFVRSLDGVKYYSIVVFGDKAEIQNETSSNNLESIVNIEKLRGCISNIVYDESVLCKKQGLTQKKLKLMNNELEKIIQPMTEISYIDKIIHIIQIKLKQLRIR